LEQSKALYSLARGLPLGGELLAPMVRDTFSQIGAFTMKNLGLTPEQFEPIHAEFKAALARDLADTEALRAGENAADAIEADIRAGQGADAAKDVISKAKSLN
jgi:hypothetical protein